MRILVLGGSGFVGRTLLRHLAQQGHQITVLVRRPERQRDLLLIPHVTLMATEHFSDLQLRKALRGQDAVINLIGVLREVGRATFAAVHVDLVRKLLIACEVEGVTRIIHLSALGADVAAPSSYLRSKGEAEALLAASDLAVTILRPSVIFGEGDRFVHRFHSMLALTPMMPVICAESQLSPVWVEDVAAVIVKTLADKHSVGQCYVLCGGRVYTLMEIWQLIAEVSGRRVRFVALSQGFSRLLARVLGWLPSPVITLDQYASLQVPSVCEQALPFHIQPRSLRSYAAQVFSPQRIRDRYVRMRQLAGRDVRER